MSNTLSTLSPTALWQHFSELNAIPRASKKETAVIQFMINFGKSLNLETITDDTGNVLIKKPATAGMENRQTVCLQSHLDMVHQKNAGTSFDFATQGIDMFVDGDWVKANGTTLGADNGIGVATIMALLAADDIPHPAIEALFTIDEETGMTGALGLKGGYLSADILLNLDTEDDHELTIGCAGGVDVSTSGSYKMIDVPRGFAGLAVGLTGLTGGHSGMDIALGRANANKLMNRLLLKATDKFDIRVNAIDGGGLRNAIPRESHAVIAVAIEDADAFADLIQTEGKVLQQEYERTDPAFKVTVEKTDLPADVLEKDFQYALLRTIAACPNGIYRMSPEIKGLVQTSNNVARVLVKDGSFSVLCLTRSAVDSEKTDLAETIAKTFELCGAKAVFSGAYPGWSPKTDAPIVALMSCLYKEMFNADAQVNAVHAGLECGIIGTNYPDMQMISFGPNIKGAHSPDEKVQISSVQKFWTFLLEVLRRIPEKK